MKVLHLIDSGGLYGAENVILNLSREMLAAGEYKPMVGCILQQRDEPNLLLDKAQELGIEAMGIVINNKRFILDVPRAAFLFKRLGVDCIHSHGYKPSVVGFVIRLLTGIQIIATCHLWYTGTKGPLKQRLMTRLELFFYRFFRRIVAVSEDIKNVLLTAGVSEGKISIIKNGIFLDDFRGRPDDIIQKYQTELAFPDDAFIVLNSARLVAQKAQANIILAAELLQKKNIPVVFLIVGEGRLRGDLETMVAQKELGRMVRILGFRDDIKNLLIIADIFILPSHDEGLPMSLLEAIASKTPAIVTPVGDIPKLVRHHESALFVPFNDINALAEAIEWLRDHPEEGRRMAETAFAILRKNYSSHQMYKEYARAYSEVI